MVFSNAILLLLGGALLTIPVILHFSMQSKPKPLPFPAFQFLVANEASSSRKLRIKQWLLLLARLMLVALPALALAGPSVAEKSLGDWYATGVAGVLVLLSALCLLAAWSKRSGRWLSIPFGLMLAGSLAWFGLQLQAALAPGEASKLIRVAEPLSAVVIVDTSPRMGYRRDNQTHFEMAKERGAAIIGQLPPESQISVIDSADIEPFFSVDAGSAIRRLKALPVSHVQPGLPTALQAAAKLLEKAEYEHREVHIVTDLSAAAWTNAKELSRLIAESKLSVFVFDVGTATPENLRLNNFRAGSMQLSGASSLALQAAIDAIGPGGERVLELKIEQPDPSRPVLRDGRVLTPEQFWTVQQSVDVPDDGSVEVAIRFEEPLPPGVHQGTLQVLGGDALIADNQRFFTVSVDQKWKVCVLHGPRVNPANISDMLSLPGYTIYEVQTAPQSELTSLDLGQFNAVFLLDPDPLPENDWDRLLRFVQQGGGLGFFPGSGALEQGNASASFNSAMASALTGGELTVPMRSPEGDNYLAPDDLGHSIFNDIRPVQSAVAWNRFPVRIYWGWQPLENDPLPGRVLVRYTNGDPAVIERVVGLGRCLLMTTPVTEPSQPEGRSAWNSLFLGSPVPAWLLLRGVTQYLVQARSESINLLAGQPATLKNDVRIHPESYTLFSPDPERPPAPVAASRGQLRYAFTEVPGHYRLKGIREAPITRGFSVNMDDASSDLTRLEAASLNEMLGAGNYKLARDFADFERQQGSSRRGREFYPLLLLVLTVILAAENLLGNRFYGKSSPAGTSRTWLATRRR